MNVGLFSNTSLNSLIFLDWENWKSLVQVQFYLAHIRGAHTYTNTHILNKFDIPQ
jgi:hypothetical protein